MAISIFLSLGVLFHIATAGSPAIAIAPTSDAHEARAETQIEAAIQPQHRGSGRCSTDACKNNES
ncbi:MAG: hypothetical protein ACFB4J_12520 [Elainellaceae cyanobacterium]